MDLLQTSRYDLLCIEGIARALRIFLQKDILPVYKLNLPFGGEKGLLTVTVSPEVSFITFYVGFFRHLIV